MLETERLEFLLESLMLASLASVVLLGKDALTRGYACREVTAAFATIDVELSDHCATVTLRALHCLAGPVGGWMPREQLDRQVFVVLALLLRQVWKPLQLHECLRAVPVALIEEARYGNDAVDLSGGQLFLIFNEPHRCLHRAIVLLLI